MNDWIVNVAVEPVESSFYPLACSVVDSVPCGDLWHPFSGHHVNQLLVYRRLNHLIRLLSPLSLLDPHLCDRFPQTGLRVYLVFPKRLLCQWASASLADPFLDRAQFKKVAIHRCGRLLNDVHRNRTSQLIDIDTWVYPERLWLNVDILGLLILPRRAGGPVSLIPLVFIDKFCSD